MSDWLWPFNSYAGSTSLGASSATSSSQAGSSCYYLVTEFRGVVTVPSFGSVVHSYLRMRGGVATDPLVRDTVRKAAADIMMLLGKHDWSFLVEEKTFYLWGSKQLTLVGISGCEVRVQETVDLDMVGQKLSIPGSSRTVPWIVKELGSGNALILDADFAGTTPSAGTKVTLYQRVVRMPVDRYVLIEPITVEGRPVPIGDQELTDWYSTTSVGVGPLVIVPRPGALVLSRPTVGYLRVRYRSYPNLVYYDDGTASVGSEPEVIVGSGTRWLRVAALAGGSPLRIDESESYEVFPYGEDVLRVDADDKIVLQSPWRGSSTFSHVLSTKLDWPGYVWSVIDVMSKLHAGKADQREFQTALLDAVTMDTMEPRSPSTDYNRSAGARSGIIVFPDFG